MNLLYKNARVHLLNPRWDCEPAVTSTNWSGGMVPLLFETASVTVQRPNDGRARVSNSNNIVPRGPSLATIKGNVLLTPRMFNTIMNATGEYAFSGAAPSLWMQGLYFENAALTSLGIVLEPFKPVFSVVEFYANGGVSKRDIYNPSNGLPMSGLFVSGDSAYAHAGTGFDSTGNYSALAQMESSLDGGGPLFTPNSLFLQLSSALSNGAPITRISMTWNIARGANHSLGQTHPTGHRLLSLDSSAEFEYADFKEMQYQDVAQTLSPIATGVQIRLVDYTGGALTKTISISGQFTDINSSWDQEPKGTISFKQKIV